MKLNKEELRKLADLEDGAMWQGICRVAKNNGYNLIANQPKHEELEKIRGILRGDIKINVLDAMRLLNTYKEKR